MTFKEIGKGICSYFNLQSGAKREPKPTPADTGPDTRNWKQKVKDYFDLRKP